MTALLLDVVVVNINLKDTNFYPIYALFFHPLLEGYSISYNNVSYTLIRIFSVYDESSEVAGASHNYKYPKQSHLNLPCTNISHLYTEDSQLNFKPLSYSLSGGMVS